MLTREEKKRYSRQILMPQIDEAGQKKLKNASALVVGLGGLGSVSAYYLTAAGVGHLCLADSDTVSLENLNRQILHQTDDLGRPKTESAVAKLAALNPGCRFRTHADRVTADNAVSLARGCDLVVDATDNAATRAVLNRAALHLEIPFVFAGVSGLDAMVTTVIPGRTPCLECIFPNLTQMDAQGPIPALGPVVAMAASIQSLEAIKWIVGMTDDTLAGRLLSIQGQSLRFRFVSLERDPSCPVCGAG